MAETHFSGAIKGNRQGSAAPKHTIPVTFADASGVAKKLVTIPGTTAQPILYRVIAAIVLTPNNAATSATLSVGIVGATYVDIINAQDLKNVAGTNMTLVSTTWKIATSDVDIYALPTYVGTPTAGVTTVMIEAVEVNQVEPSVTL